MVNLQMFEKHFLVGGGRAEEESFTSDIIQITALVMSSEQNNQRKVPEDLM